MSKILLAEDNEMNRDMLSRRLERKGFEVVIAIDGQAGVEMAFSTNPDIILMDLSLPPMFATLRLIRDLLVRRLAW